MLRVVTKGSRSAYDRETIVRGSGEASFQRRALERDSEEVL